MTRGENDATRQLFEKAYDMMKIASEKNHEMSQPQLTNGFGIEIRCYLCGVIWHALPTTSLAFFQDASECPGDE